MAYYANILKHFLSICSYRTRILSFCIVKYFFRKYTKWLVKRLCSLFSVFYFFKPKRLEHRIAKWLCHFSRLQYFILT